MQDKNEPAETFFEAATSFDQQNIMAWTMLGEKQMLVDRPFICFFFSIEIEKILKKKSLL